MAKNPLIIELGERAVRVSRPRAGDAKRAVLDPGLTYAFPLPAGTVDDGFVVNPAELGYLLRTELNEQKFKGRDTVFVLNSGKIVVREVLMPPVTGDKKIKAMVDANLAEYFPIDLSGYRLEYTVLGLTDEGAADEQKLRVSVIAVPLTLLDGYTELAKAAGLKITALDYAGNSQYQLFRHLNAEGVNMYAFIDHESARITFMRGNEMLLQRSLSIGGGVLADEYLRLKGKSGAEAYREAIGELSRPGFDDPLLTPELAQSTFSRLSVGIERSLRYFNSKYGSSEVNQAILTGPLAEIYHLREIVAAELALNVILMSEQPEALLHLEFAEKAQQFLTCVGASIAPNGFIETKAAAKEAVSKKADKTSVSSIAGGGLIAVVAVLAAGLVTFSAYLDLSAARVEKAAIEADIASKQYAEDIYKDYRVYKDGADASGALLESLKSHNDDLEAFFVEVEEKMPPEILLLSASCNAEGITLNITVPEKSDVARVMVQFRTFESLSVLTVPSLTESTAETGGYVSFSLYYEYYPHPSAQVPDDPYTGETDVEQDLSDYAENDGAAEIYEGGAE
ncbi:MAG: pilus assembly protein PilM [Oscillospiraceae bacterium]|jgi:type IV pilus assembly protein PilM|nr:pilus assembly protein PilM [Oscillospiraceae bacterium]